MAGCIAYAGPKLIVYWDEMRELRRVAGSGQFRAVADALQQYEQQTGGLPPSLETLVLRGDVPDSYLRNCYSAEWPRSSPCYAYYPSVPVQYEVYIPVLMERPGYFPRGGGHVLRRNGTIELLGEAEYAELVHNIEQWIHQSP